MNIERRVAARRGYVEPKAFRALCKFAEKRGGKILIGHGLVDLKEVSDVPRELNIIVTKNGKNRQSRLVPRESHMEIESAALLADLTKSDVFKW